MISITSAILGSFRVGSFSIIANFWASDNVAGRVVLLRRTVRFLPPSEPSLRRLRWPRAWATSPEVMKEKSVFIAQFEHIRIHLRARASISSAVGSSCHFLSNSLSNSWPYPLPSDRQLKLDRGQESADVTGLANAPNSRTRWVETITVIEHELEITPKLFGFHILIVCELVLNRH